MTKIMQRYPYDSSAISESEGYTYIPDKNMDTGLKKITNFFANAWSKIKRGFRYKNTDQENR
jgi:hypothetical protein